MASSDEVISKYFSVDCSPNNNYPPPSPPLYNMSIPEGTRKILQELDLSSDFLSSDSSLSDVPSDFEPDSPLPPPPMLFPDQFPPRYSTPPPRSPIKSPTKSAYFLQSANATPSRAKPPKISPYFPSLLGDPESCLPFPPTDAPSFGLIQEQLAHDPFRLLIATIFLNRTRGGVALPVLFQVFERYPTIQAMADAELSDLVSMIHCLGFQNQRAKKCVMLAQTWLSAPPVNDKRYRKLHYPRKLDGRDIGRDECVDNDDPRVAWEIAHLPGVGAYSLDSWRIFCRDKLRDLATDWKGTGATAADFVPEWKTVLPQDKELRAYLTWMWLKEGWLWDRHSGDLTPANDKVLRAAQRGGVAHEEHGNWVLETSPTKPANGLHAME